MAELSVTDISTTSLVPEQTVPLAALATPPGSVGVVSPQYISFTEPLALTSGQVLPSYEPALETYGVINQARPHAVLICPALPASHHVAGVTHNDLNAVRRRDNREGPG